MPEGDTIHRTATRLRPALQGAVVERFEAQRLVGTRPRAGESVELVEARGKHLLIGFSGGLTLDTHMRMTGSWHLYRSGERWQRAAHLARVVIGVPGWSAVCFSAPVVRTFPTPGDREVHTPLDHLGPDLCRSDADLDDCAARMASLGADVSVADALLDQRVCCGVGNVYKSEVCWACRVHPFDPVTSVDGARQREMIATSARLLQANLDTGTRTTVPGGLAVYGRRGRPCLRCGTAIRSRLGGDQARVTYWCPICQPPR